MSETEAGAQYVVGFMFNPAENAVLLLRKNRPSWQVDKLNGIGGRIEDGESPAEAMRRECLEEVGLDCDTWRQFCVLSDERQWQIYFFSAVGQIGKAQQLTDEKPEIVCAFALPFGAGYEIRARVQFRCPRSRMRQRPMKKKPKIEMLVLSIATNHFKVPLPTGADVIRAVNSHGELVKQMGFAVSNGHKWTLDDWQNWIANHAQPALQLANAPLLDAPLLEKPKDGGN